MALDSPDNSHDQIVTPGGTVLIENKPKKDPLVFTPFEIEEPVENDNKEQLLKGSSDIEGQGNKKAKDRYAVPNLNFSDA